MNPIAIISAISAAKEAIEAAIKVKEKFFDAKPAAPVPVDVEAPEEGLSNQAMQGEIDVLKQQLAQLMSQAEQDRMILEQQNGIIIELSTAVKLTAESAKSLKAFSIVAIILSAGALAFAMYIVMHGMAS